MYLPFTLLLLTASVYAGSGESKSDWSVESTDPSVQQAEFAALFFYQLEERHFQHIPATAIKVFNNGLGGIPLSLMAETLDKDNIKVLYIELMQTIFDTDQLINGKKRVPRSHYFKLLRKGGFAAFELSNIYRELAIIFPADFGLHAARINLLELALSFFGTLYQQGGMFGDQIELVKATLREATILRESIIRSPGHNLRASNGTPLLEARAASKNDIPTPKEVRKARKKLQRKLSEASLEIHEDEGTDSDEEQEEIEVQEEEAAKSGCLCGLFRRSARS